MNNLELCGLLGFIALLIPNTLYGIKALRDRRFYEIRSKTLYTGNQAVVLVSIEIIAPILVVLNVAYILIYDDPSIVYYCFCCIWLPMGVLMLIIWYW